MSVSFEFVALPSRRFVTVALDDPACRLDGCFVKVRGTVTEDEYRRLDLRAIEAEMTGDMCGAYSVTFDVTVERAHRDRAHVLTDGQSRVEQLAAYLEATGVNGSTGAAMLARAEAYLA